MNLEKRIEKWTTAKVIDSETANRILQFEREQPSASWVLYGICGLGVTALITGIVSTIAANWNEISDYTKLFLYFLWLSLLGFAIVKRLSRPGIVSECLFVVFAGSVLAGIGLIGQIFNLKSDGYSAIFFWLALILPITLCSQGRFLNNVWFFGLLVALVLWNGAESLRREQQEVVWSVTLAIPFLLLGFGYGATRFFPSGFCQAARIWSYGSLLIGFGIFANFQWAENLGFMGKRVSATVTLYGWGAALLACVLAFFREAPRSKKMTFAILYTILMLALLILPAQIKWSGRHEILGCLLFMLSWSGAAAMAAISDRKRLFDFTALVIGIRFIVVYFEVIGSLAATGAGLIVSGCVILGVAYIWYRYRARVALSLREAA